LDVGGAEAVAEVPAPAPVVEVAPAPKPEPKPEPTPELKPEPKAEPKPQPAAPAPTVVQETEVAPTYDLSPDHSSPPPVSTEAYAGPATRKFARELGVDVALVTGTGAHGRITTEDVQAFVKAKLQAAPVPQAVAALGMQGIPSVPAQDFSQFGEITVQSLARIRKISAQHLHRAWLNVPHVTQFDEVDISDLEAFRKSASSDALKLSVLPFVLKAVGVALKQFPEFNSSLSPDGEALILKNYCHLGFAADTPNGLVVPVVKDVWQKSIGDLARESAALAKKAREGKLSPNEMKGGCFSVSSLGGIGGGHFTPIVNTPEVAILGVSKAVTKPAWDGHAFQPRLMLPLSLSYDHRVIDGAQAARFMVFLVQLLSDIRRLSL
jgi:pyruvate dehydrogenase E2 component (dihydrolipoamide acetyltransferase)